MKDIGPSLEKTRPWYNALAILTLNAIVILVCAELLSLAWWGIRTHVIVREQAPEDARAFSSYYESKDWAAQYWREFAIVRKQQYRAFTTWRRAPFHGQLIRIDDRGVRFTPGADCGPGAFRVFAFGSSHMWGTGAPDWGTIPAYLQAGLQKYRGGPICVTNFGESAYVSTQSVVELILQLQAGNIPNVAIFFDGGGDIYAAYQSGRPAVHQNFELTASVVEPRGQATTHVALQLLEKSLLFQLVSGQVSRLSAESSAPAKLVTYETMNVDGPALSKTVARTYLANYQIVAALAQRYGFEYYFFWPPHVSAGRKELTTEEERATHGRDPALQSLYDSVSRAVEGCVSPKYTNLFSITDVFDNRKELIWLDESHTTPEGNRIIAERMLSLIRRQHSLGN